MEDKCVFLFASCLSYGVRGFNRDIIGSYTLRIFESGRVIKSSVESDSMSDRTIGTFPELAKKVSAIIESHAEAINELKDFYYPGGFSDPAEETFGFGNIRISGCNIQRWTDEVIEIIKTTNPDAYEKNKDNIKKVALLLDIYDEIAEVYNKYVMNTGDRLKTTKPEIKGEMFMCPGLVGSEDLFSWEDIEGCSPFA